MTPREADRIIKAGHPVTVRDRHFNETFTATFVRRDRWQIKTSTGGLFERADLEIVKA